MKIIKKIIKTIIYTFIVLSSSLIFLFGWLNTRLDDALSPDSYDKAKWEIAQYPSLPSDFYEIYGEVTGYTHNSEIRTVLYKLPLDIIFKNQLDCFCPCFEANYRFVLKTIDRWTVAIALDKEVKPQKCLDFYLGTLDFLNGAIGIQNASNFYYGKELKNLSEYEMYELSVMSLNPSLYNKHRRQKELSEKVLEYMGNNKIQ